MNEKCERKEFRLVFEVDDTPDDRSWTISKIWETAVGTGATGGSLLSVVQRGVLEFVDTSSGAAKSL